MLFFASRLDFVFYKVKITTATDNGAGRCVYMVYISYNYILIVMLSPLISLRLDSRHRLLLLPAPFVGRPRKNGE